MHAHACTLSSTSRTHDTTAILVEFQDELVELEHSELMGFLQHLPPMDMDQVRCVRVCLCLYVCHAPCKVGVGLHVCLT